MVVRSYSANYPHPLMTKRHISYFTPGSAPNSAASYLQTWAQHDAFPDKQELILEVFYLLKAHITIMKLEKKEKTKKRISAIHPSVNPHSLPGESILATGGNSSGKTPDIHCTHISRFTWPDLSQARRSISRAYKNEDGDPALQEQNTLRTQNRCYLLSLPVVLLTHGSVPESGLMHKMEFGIPISWLV
jgi:hypothetical protein